jgi:hypothetical protein
MAASQVSTLSAGTPDFLKSWKATCRSWSAIQALAFLTVSQFVMP